MQITARLGWKLYSSQCPSNWLIFGFYFHFRVKQRGRGPVWHGHLIQRPRTFFEEPFISSLDKKCKKNSFSHNKIKSWFKWDPLPIPFDKNARKNLFLRTNQKLIPDSSCWIFIFCEIIRINKNIFEYMKMKLPLLTIYVTVGL